MLIKTLVALMFSGALYGAAILSVAPSPIQANVGSSFQLEVAVSGVPDLVGFQFDISYPSFLTLDNVLETGYFAANGASWFAGIHGAGIVTGVSDVLVEPGPLASPANLVKLLFTAAGPGTGEVSLGGIMLIDSTFQDVAIDGVNTATVSTVPEPENWVLTLIGGGVVAGLGLARRRAIRRARFGANVHTGSKDAHFGE